MKEAIGIIWRLLRVRQYTKNLFVFAAPLFAGVTCQPEILIQSILLFCAFCCISSAVYIFNDIRDIDKDRQHPQKSKRPIPNGDISIRHATVVGMILLGVGFIIPNQLGIEYLLAVYVLLNIIYTMHAKHVVILDVMCISFGFVIRALAGIVIIPSQITSWFLLCVFMLSLFLALGKRRAELELFKDERKRQRQVLQSYTLPFVDQLIMIVAAMTLTSYSLFAVNQGHGENEIIAPMVYTVPLVVYGVFRYLYLIYVKGEGGQPEELLLRDRYILGIGIVFVAAIFFLRNL